MADISSDSSSASAILALLGVVSFIQLIGFSIYECISKVARPNSTVHFTRTSVALCGAMIGLFLICITDTGSYAFGTDSTLTVIVGQLGWSIFLSLYSYFLVVIVNPILGKSVSQILVQDLAAVVSVLAACQIPLLIIWAVNVDDTLRIIVAVRAGVQLLAFASSCAYIWLFMRRRKHQLRISRGNEPAMCRYGLIVTSTFALAIVFSLSRDYLYGSQYLLVVSRLLLNVTLVGSIAMKLAYARGLMRNVNGKIVFSRGYAVTNTEETDALTKLRKADLGIGALA